MELQLQGNDLDPGIVLGWMLFPTSQDLRELYLLRNRLASLVDECGEDDVVQLPAGSLERLLAGPGRQELRDLAGEATKRGTVAGDLLTLAYEQHALGLPASKEKAVNRYKEWAPGNRYGDGEALKYSRATLLSYFDEFRSVAHFWAAHRVNQFSDQPIDAFGSPDGLQAFLGLARSFSDFATSYCPPNTKQEVPLIPGAALVRMPAEISPREIPLGLKGRPV